MEGNQIAATWDDFDCLATSPAGFGDVIGEAVADLVKNSNASVMNAIVCGIENERYEERASESAELAATVPPVGAANSQGVTALSEIVWDWLTENAVDVMVDECDVNILIQRLNAGVPALHT